MRDIFTMDLDQQQFHLLLGKLNIRNPRWILLCQVCKLEYCEFKKKIRIVM